MVTLGQGQRRALAIGGVVPFPPINSIVYCTSDSGSEYGQEKPAEVKHE